MRKVIQKNAVIDGEGKAFPYVVVADLADVGIICKTATNETVILQAGEIQSITTYRMKPPEKEQPTPPTVDKPVKTTGKGA